METSAPRRKFKDLGISLPERKDKLVGDSIEIEKLFGKEITVHGGRIKDSSKIPGTKYVELQVEVNGVKKVVFNASKTIMDQIEEAYKKDGFPFDTVITVDADNNSHSFT
jgi:hypothetical protein